MGRFGIALLAGALPLLLCRCVTTEQTAGSQSPPVRVEGRLFYPDDSNRTYIVPSGAEIIGAGGRSCKYIVENGGKLSAHSGTKNTYLIKSGGSFKGFEHPASNCKVVYEPGATVERIQTGSGVEFLLDQ